MPFFFIKRRWNHTLSNLVRLNIVPCLTCLFQCHVAETQLLYYYCCCCYSYKDICLCHCSAQVGTHINDIYPEERKIRNNDTFLEPIDYWLCNTVIGITDLFFFFFLIS
ncbi:hypothetical protein BCR42DRAFT_416661 [Absidia repens]|uniref:Uncharacterized protein n=1 Tax=Absidia repens TaxID=90262 RepID=A0A1X2IGA8_9FUNG|nr:hypothetical protein BCR42DRAFT_416661 [Absidia repens]